MAAAAATAKADTALGGGAIQVGGACCAVGDLVAGGAEPWGAAAVGSDVAL